MYWNPNYEFFTPTGWRCPSCGRIYSPNTSMCPCCGGSSKTYYTINTDDVDWWKKYLEKNVTGYPTWNQEYNTTARTGSSQNTDDNNCIDILDNFIKH